MLTRATAVALLGGLILYAAHFPSDSIQVEAGDALWTVAMALTMWMLTASTEPHLRRPMRAGGGERRAGGLVGCLLGDGVLLDLLVWNLAGWMMLAALLSCPPGNLRDATNEAWLWIAAAAVFSSARRLLSDRGSQKMVVTLLFAVAVGMAVHALHQHWISLPETRAAYLADPDKVIAAAGIDAPRGSARRMLFANRLLDGGPTATFALANSLAGVLAPAAVLLLGLLSLRLLSFRRRAAQSSSGPAWSLSIFVVLLVVVGAALLATRSRSAIIACLFGWLCWFALWQRHQDVAATGRWRRLLAAVMLVSFVGASVAMMLLLFGNPEWMSAAPASLEFRLQYWRSTVALLVDHPILGAGPGGFRGMYLQYRLPQANEAIADPHNFVFETLAAGGIPAGILLLGVLVACFRWRNSMAQRSTEPAQEPTQDSADEWGGEVAAVDPRWMLYGAATAGGLIWLLGSISGNLPDPQAAIIAIPVAVAAGVLLHAALDRLPTRAVDPLVAAALAASLVHLTVSGGWTVPGLAMLIWVSTGLLCRTPTPHSNSHRDRTGESIARRISLAAFIGVGGLLIALRVVSIGPVQEAQFALQRAQQALRQNLGPQAERESAAAIEADPWDQQAALWRSEVLLQRLVARGGESSDRNQWQQAVEVALARVGDDPLALRSIAEQYLRIYQMSGRRADLERAGALLDQALRGNPHELSLVAQVALVADVRGDSERALELSGQAIRLSKLGGNVVRDLGLQRVLVVRHLPRRREILPLGDSIENQFREQLGVQTRG
jgi:O-antigen ligase